MGSNKNQILDFDKAWASFKKLPDRATTAAVNPQSYRTILDLNKLAGKPHCPVCGSEVGCPGFVRLPFPIGHEYFGMLIRCPRCNGRGRV